MKQIDDGESWLLDAKRIATAQTARGPELAATTSIARLWQSQDKSAAAHALLFPVYDWFSESFETAALKDAKALLDELAPA
ncbi:MAG: hypothetical protein VCC99_01295 [Alphaproteobacteria bacterium]